MDVELDGGCADRPDGTYQCGLDGCAGLELLKICAHWNRLGKLTRRFYYGSNLALKMTLDEVEAGNRKAA